jgi:hypothetical protein
MVGRGAAHADIDGGGDLDLVLTASGQAPRLLRNEQPSERRWLRLAVQGTQSNRSAIGAQIEIRVGDRTLFGQVMPTRSYLSQVELPVTFGLGTATHADQVRIRWPSGTTQTLDNVPSNQTLRLTEPAAQTTGR